MHLVIIFLFSSSRKKHDLIFVIRMFKGAVTLLFTLACFGLAGYMALLQFQAYVSNDDSSVVSYKEFDGYTDDEYPTFTVCLVGEGGTILDQTVNGKSIDRLRYYRTLIGKYEDDRNFSLIRFEDRAIDILPIIKTFNSVTKQGRVIRKKGLFVDTNSNPPFVTTYNDPNHVCYTKTEKDENGILLRYDYLELNGADMMRSFNNYDMYFFVHQKGQLLKKLGEPDFVLKHETVKKTKDNVSYKVKMRVNAVDVLTKRPDAEIPCNVSLHDVDSRWISNAVDALGCIPAFFKRFSTNTTLPAEEVTKLECTKEQYLRFNKNFIPDYNFGQIASMYLQPCSQIHYIVTSTDSLIDEKEVKDIYLDLISSTSKKLGKVEIKIEYAILEFRETKNYRAFGVLSLWSQIGGFIGIFLGYSLLQVPDLIGSIFKWGRDSIPSN